jgi:hypothetical protein
MPHRPIKQTETPDMLNAAGFKCELTESGWVTDAPMEWEPPVITNTVNPNPNPNPPNPNPKNDFGEDPPYEDGENDFLGAGDNRVSDNPNKPNETPAPDSEAQLSDLIKKFSKESDKPTAAEKETRKKLKKRHWIMVKPSAARPTANSAPKNWKKMSL